MQNKKIVYKKISEIKDYENNPRINEKAVQKVAESIREFNFQNPIIIDKNNVIVCGHTRVRAAKQLKLDVVPCIVADDLTPEQTRAFRLADNKTSEFSDWDIEKLDAELAALDIDMTLFGFEDGTSKDKSTTERKDLSDAVSEVYEVIVECADENEQEEIFNRLQGEGLQCRVLTL